MARRDRDDEGTQSVAEALRLLAIASDRTLPQVRRDPGATRDAWQALLAGEWRLIEAFEIDGRHFLVARRVAPRDARLPLLSDREQRALALRARAYSVKSIASELRISAASASRALTSAMQKLGIHSPTQMGAMGTATDSTPSHPSRAGSITPGRALARPKHRKE